MQGTWLKLKARLLLLDHLGTWRPTLQCPAQVQKFTHCSLGLCIHSPAVPRACANGRFVPDTGLGSWVDSQSKEMVSALSNCNVMQNRPPSCAVGTHASRAPGLWPPCQDTCSLTSFGSLLTLLCPGGLPPSHAITPCLLTQPYHGTYSS